jgi:hypothetical protein
MLNDSYLKILDGLDEEIEGIEKDLGGGNSKGQGKTRKDRDMAYKKVKVVVDEIKRAEQKVEEKKEKSKLKQTHNLFRQLMIKHFPDKIIEERKQQEQAAKQPPPSPAAAPSPSAAQPSIPILASKIAALIDPKSNREQELIDLEVRQDLLADYAERICECLRHKHNGCYYQINYPRLNEIKIYDTNDEVMLKIGINDFLSIDNVIPVGKLYQICPFHTVEFYQKYWKPVVESVGHFCINNPPVLIVVGENTLPDVMRETVEQPTILEGWNSAKSRKEPVEICFKGEHLIWVIKISDTQKTASNDKEIQRYSQNVLKRVKCIDNKLESINGKEGVIIQSIPIVNPDFEEIDVDFGKIGIVRLTTRQVVSIGV